MAKKKKTSHLLDTSNIRIRTLTTNRLTAIKKMNGKNSLDRVITEMLDELYPNIIK